MAVHVPAWKRLGLKLKYANEAPDTTSTAGSDEAHGQSQDPQGLERPLKRRRMNKTAPDEQPRQNGIQSSFDDPTGVQSPNNELKLNGSFPSELPSTSGETAPLRRKKSVTFTSETKQEDGDSRITIDFPADSSGSPGSTPKKSKKSNNNGALNPPSDDQTTAGPEDDRTPTKKPKKPKIKSPKKSKTSASSSSNSKDKSNLALSYLHQHLTNRSSWKFNKILDVWILNHALDTQSIPSTHLPALAGYIHGLPPNAGSRTRLTKECNEALTTQSPNPQITNLPASVTEQDRQTFTKLLSSDHETYAKNVAADDGHKYNNTDDLFERHSRPKLLLWSLGHNGSDLTPAPPSATRTLQFSSATSSTPTASAVVSTKKSRKSRTAAPIDLSSSSESESSSDSDSDSDSDADSDAGAEQQNGRVARDEETSSSGSSGSESDGDSSSSSASSSEDEDDEDNSD